MIQFRQIAPVDEEGIYGLGRETDKGRNTSALLQEFEKQFTGLLTLDRTVLDTSKVLRLVRSREGGSPLGDG